MWTTRTRVVALLAVAAALTGCGGGGPGAPADPDLAVGDGTWELVEGTVDGEALTVPDGYRVTLRVEGDQAGGTAACNGYGASWQVDGSRVSVGEEVWQTQMGCEPDVMTAESTYLSALPRVRTGSRDADGLLLSGDGVELRFVEQPDVPTEALVGTTWMLDTLLDADVAASVGGEPATLLLADDGTLTGSTGCRALSGEYTVAGDEVLFTTFAADGDCPADLEGQDSHVVAVLGDGFRAVVEGDRLTLSSTDGLGLGYRAG